MDDYVNMNYDRLQFFGGKRNSKKGSKKTNKKTSKSRKGGDNIEEKDDPKGQSQENKEQEVNDMKEENKVEDD